MLLSIFFLICFSPEITDALNKRFLSKLAKNWVKLPKTPPPVKNHPHISSAPCARKYTEMKQKRCAFLSSLSHAHQKINSSAKLGPIIHSVSISNTVKRKIERGPTACEPECPEAAHVRMRTYFCGFWNFFFISLLQTPPSPNPPHTLKLEPALFQC